MRNDFKAAATALGVALLLCIGASAATANRSLRISGGGRVIRGTDANSVLTFGSRSFSCTSTMTQTLHAGIPKARGNLFGNVTGLTVSGCVTGILESRAIVTTLFETPWHITYRSFAGTLPRISVVGIEVVNARLLIAWEGRLDCLYSGNMQMALSGRTEAGGLIVEQLSSLEDALTLFRALREELLRCPESIDLFLFYRPLIPNFTLTLG